MTLRGSSARLAMSLIASLALGAVQAGAQGTIAHAKDLYQSADYDEALSALDQLMNDPDAKAVQEIAAYRVFCLVALGRSDEAHQAIGVILRQDPRYEPSESETSPRIRAVFRDERRRLLPQIFQERYERAKASFDGKDFQSAADQFKALISLIDDPALMGEESRAEFRMVISGFFDLAQAAGSTQAPPLTAAPPVVAVETPRIYDANDTDVIPPVSVTRKMPPWRPGDAQVGREYSGQIELVLDERGNVAAARIRKSVHPLFDPELAQAARDWKFRPALKGGQPVRYRWVVEVKLVP